MRGNRVKEKLNKGEVAIAVGGHSNTGDTIDFLGPLGFDGIWLEGEHGSVSWGGIGDLSRACDLWGMASVARLHQNDPGVITRILDLGVNYRGYYADASRVFAVTTPTDEQERAHRQAVDTLAEVKRMARPGVACLDLFNLARERMDEIVPGGMFHHLGHGIGLCPHERPYLNPAWPDGVLAEGDVITVEPGVYGDGLRGGVRVEDDMLVTADGVRTLIHAPKSLRPLERDA